MELTNSQFYCSMIMLSFLCIVPMLMSLVRLGPVRLSREDFSFPAWKVKTCMPALSKLSRGKALSIQKPYIHLLTLALEQYPCFQLCLLFHRPETLLLSFPANKTLVVCWGNKVRSCGGYLGMQLFLKQLSSNPPYFSYHLLPTPITIFSRGTWCC